MSDVTDFLRWAISSHRDRAANRNRSRGSCTGTALGRRSAAPLLL